MLAIALVIMLRFLYHVNITRENSAIRSRALEVISISKRGPPLLFLCDRRVSLCARLRRALVELIEDLFTQTI
jgi:hypothetical protein